MQSAKPNGGPGTRLGTGAVEEEFVLLKVVHTFVCEKKHDKVVAGSKLAE